MKVGVTGACGLQGGRLCRVLSAAGHKVVGVDHCRRAANVPEGENIQFVQADCMRGSLLQEVFEGCEAVFHLAAHLGGHRYIEDHAFEVFSDNVSIDASVFKACATLKIPRLVYASSGCVYASDRHGESVNFLEEPDAWVNPNPDCAYGWGKLIGEMMLRNFPIPYRIVLRLFSVYGDAHSGATGQVVPDLVNKVIEAKDGGAVHVYGNGMRKLSLLFVDDVVDAYMKSLTQPLESGLHIMNIAARSVTVRELVEGLIQVSGKKLRPNFEIEGGTEQCGRNPETRCAQERLGWQPTTELLEGLRRAYQFHCRHKNQNSNLS